MAGAVNALATTGLVFPEGPWRGIGDLGLATLGRVVRFTHTRLRFAPQPLDRPRSSTRTTVGSVPTGDGSWRNRPWSEPGADHSWPHCRGDFMTTIAVIAHAGKSFGGGLGELRRVLDDAGFPQPLWYEVAKSSQAPKCARQAMTEGADVLFVWGGDGTVQRCIDAVAGTGAVVAVLPAGTANLLATNLGIPQDISEAVEIGLHGDRRSLDTGTVNGEHFTVMAGAGLDALMIKDADAGLKDRFGRAAYLWTGARNLAASPVRAKVDVEGRRFYKGEITCVLVGNVKDVFGGIEVFDGSRPDDGLLELGVVTAKSLTQWVRTVSRVVLGRAQNSPFVVTTRGSRIRVRFDRPIAYELDGGVRKATKKLRIKVRPKSITVCVPVPDPSAEAGQG